MPRTAPWGLHARKIILQSLLVTTPMVASSVIVTWIVYANIVSESCPYEELCPRSSITNTTSKGYYYVDFPAARLAFISSGSSTLSFALIGFLMNMYAYTNAALLLRASEKAEHGALPSPYQMSVLLKILNAEFMMLWDLAFSKVKRVFWKREKDAGSSFQSPPVLESGVMVLMAGIIARCVYRFQGVLKITSNDKQPARSSCRCILPYRCGSSRIGPGSGAFIYKLSIQQRSRAMVSG